MRPYILTLDIETCPALVYAWGLGKQFLGPHQLVEPDRMICYSAKWRHEKKVQFYSEFHHGWREMIRRLHELMTEADVIVTYNGDRFDIPWAKRSFREYNVGLEEGEEPLPSLPKFISVDLFKVARKEKWLSLKLAYLTQRLNLTGKLEGTDFELWLGCMKGDAKAWNKMRRYSKQDVVTTEETFEEYLPEINNLPSAALFDPFLNFELPTCSCGSTRLQRRGWAVSKTRRYPRFQCQECGRWIQGTQSEGGVGTR